MENKIEQGDAKLLTTDQLRLRLEKVWLKHIKLCQDNFLYFVKEVWPDFICREEKEPSKWGHHQIIASEFTKISKDKKGRLIVNMPPRHTKSEFASVYFPAWIIGKFPKMKLMQVSHNAELSARFGSKVRNLIDSPVYKQIFGDVKLREDSKAKGRWETNHGGEYYAAGVGGSITGRGADLLIIDDPHTEQDSLSDSAMERTFDWYLSGPRQRLQPGGSIVLVMTRWASDDLTGRLIRSQTEPKADKWHHISFPALIDDVDPVEEPLMVFNKENGETVSITTKGDKVYYKYYNRSRMFFETTIEQTVSGKFTAGFELNKLVNSEGSAGIHFDRFKNFFANISDIKLYVGGDTSTV